MKLKIGYFVIGNLIFNIIFSISKTMGINKIGGKERFIPNFCSSFQETFVVYTILFIILLLLDFLYKKNIVNQLNQKLYQTKERSEENEK